MEGGVSRGGAGEVKVAGAATVGLLRSCPGREIAPMNQARRRGAGSAGLGGWLGLIALVLAGILTPARAQNTPDSVDALRRELINAREEIRQLREENARLRGERPAAPASALTPVATAAGPFVPAPTPASASSSAAPVVVLPAPMAEGSAVTVDQLLADYRVSALAGDARFKGRRLRVSGTVHSFKKAFVGLGWTVQMKATDQLGMVRCQVQFPGISDFRPYPPTLILEGRRPFREWRPLLQQGEKAEFEGVCEGIDEAVIAFRECKPVAP